MPEASPPRSRLLACAAAALALLAAPAAFAPAPRFVWNASASAPVGLYLVSPGAVPALGETVIARLPAEARALASARGYVPASVPLVKRVVAVGGSRACAMGSRLFVDGRLAAVRLERDWAERPLPWWRECRRLRLGEVLLLMPQSPKSFDGRYFGPTPERDIVGTARLLWRG